MTARLPVPRRRRAPRLPLALAVAFGLASPAGHAGNASQPFEVRVDLARAPVVATCSESTTRADKTQVSIACVAPTKAPLPAPTHVLLHIFREADWIGTVDGILSTGTVTSWRVVRLAQREYLEMTVGW